MQRFKKLMAALCAAVCTIALMATPVYADTNGTEMHVAQASQLDIQLGTAWSGVEFQLKTDAGIYPDTIIVGEDGILRLEIGGSNTYMLTCLNSVVEAPQIGDAISAETTNSDAESTPAPEKPDVSQDELSVNETLTKPDTSEAPDEETDMPNDEEGKKFAGIPTMHIVLFGGGLLLAVGGLIAIRVVGKRRKELDDYDDDYEDE